MDSRYGYIPVDCCSDSGAPMISRTEKRFTDLKVENFAVVGPSAATASATCPEIEVLLGCARTRMEREVTERVASALKNGIDWDFVVEEALYHGTAPLLYWNLSRFGCNSIPGSTLGQLKGAFNAIARWNLSMTGELLKLLNLFRDQGIRAFPFKGPVLAAAAYGNLSLRHFGDLDILLARDDILKAKEALTSKGYHAKLPPDAGEEAAYLKAHHDYKFVRADEIIVVEIQWGITQRFFAFPLDFEGLWKRRQEISLAGAAVASLPPEDLLLVLCVHGAKHYWDQLKWICDIAEFLRTYREKIDWNFLVTRARTQGGERMLLLGLHLARDLLGAECPEATLQGLDENPKIKSLAGEVAARLFRDAPEAERLRDEKPFFYWKVRERWRDKLAILRKYLPEYFARIVVPNVRDQEFLPLPRFLGGLYYIIRPVRLIYDRWSRRRRRLDQVGN